MKQLIFLLAALATTTISFSQKVNGKLKFEQGQVLQVKTEVKTTISQEAMGQMIDFNVDGTADHAYKVTNTTDDNSTLHHSANRIQFNFEGMGTKRPFDSDKEKDQKSNEGKTIKELLKKNFDMIVDPSGKVLMVQPVKQPEVVMEGPMKLIGSMMRDVLDVVNPPANGTNSFFKIFPDKEIEKGDTWDESYQTEEGKFSNTYTLDEINDTTIVISFTGVSATSSKVEMMPGMEITTTMKNNSTGKIIADKTTGIVRQKTITVDSKGTTQGMGGETPITSKTAITVTIAPGK